MSLTTAGIYSTISPLLSGAMEDCSILRVLQLQMLYRRRCCRPMSASQRTFMHDLQTTYNNFLYNINYSLTPTNSTVPFLYLVIFSVLFHVSTCARRSTNHIDPPAIDSISGSRGSTCRVVRDHTAVSQL